MIHLLLTLVLTFLYTHALIYLSDAYARRHLMQAPHAHGTHTQAIPRGVGLSVVIVCLITLISLLFTHVNFPASLALVLIIGGLILAAVGFWDDHGHISPLIRLLVQAVVVLFTLYQIGGFPILYLFNQPIVVGLAGNVFAALGMIWFINLYNFTDGIDGQAGCQTIFVSINLAAMAYLLGFLSLSWLMLVLSASMAAFLFWNWQPAKVFMGDVCSCFLGFLFAGLMAYTARDQMIPLLTWLILFALPITDMTYTLIVRLLKGYSYHQTHCTHAFQQAVGRFGSHQAVVLGGLAIHLFWLAPFAWASFLWPQADVWFFLIAIAPVFYLVVKLGAGKENNFSNFNLAPRDRFELPTK